jgi:hypothetical protein
MGLGLGMILSLGSRARVGFRVGFRIGFSFRVGHGIRRYRRFRIGFRVSVWIEIRVRFIITVRFTVR